MPPVRSKKVVIDCDVGVDDALALVLAFHSSELEVLAVTAVNGNVPLDQVFPNIQKVLTLIGPRKLPRIAKGAAQPLSGTPTYAHSVHGPGGLGGAQIALKPLEQFWEMHPGSADELMIELARKYPGDITLVALGPLTNLALAFQKDPEGMKLLRELIIMGGAVREKGNLTSHAEFNFFSDPLAAKIMVESGIPIILVPLDATHQVSLTPRIMEEHVQPRKNRFSQFVMDACQYDPHQKRFRGVAKGVYLHDPLAVGIAIDSGLARRETLLLAVEAGEGEFFGKVLEGISGGSRVDVCFDVESERFLDLFISRLKE